MPRGITQEQVDQAADAIVATGERPTVEKIRNRLGTGSPNTVTRMLDGWRQGLSERLRQVSLLPELPDEVGQAMTALWTQALQHARAQAQQELQAEHEALQRATADLDARASEVAAKLAAMQDDVARSSEAARLAAAEVKAQRQLIERLESENQDRAQERERLLAENQALSVTAAELRKQAQHMETRMTGERERWQQHIHMVEDRSHEQVDRARVDLKAARAELAEARKQHREDQRLLQERVTALTRTLSTAEREASRQRGIAEALTLQLGRGHGSQTGKRKRPVKTSTKSPRNAPGR